MYLLKVEAPDRCSPAIERRMSSNKASELLPVAIEICKAVHHFVNPAWVNMGNNEWRVFDNNMPWFYAKVHITRAKN